MKEYEHMIMAIDEVICHNVAGIICMENYRGCYFPNGFRKVFDLFCKFREEYELNAEKYKSEESMAIESIKHQIKCRENREDLLSAYIKELQNIFPDIDYKEEVRNFNLQLEQEDIQTPEMYLTIYPLLISMIRKEEERKDEK